MKNVLVYTAMAAALVASGMAFGDPSGSSGPGTSTTAVGGGAVGVVGVGGAGVVGMGSSSSSVGGSFNADLNGPGSIQGSFTAGNQSYANTNVSVGATQSNGTTAATAVVTGSPGSTDASSGFSQSAAVGFTIGSQSGSENFGSADFTTTGKGSGLDIDSHESGKASGDYWGGEGLVGGGGAGGGGFDMSSSSIGAGAGGSPWGHF